jgi:hypothetical protein
MQQQQQQLATTATVTLMNQSPTLLLHPRQRRRSFDSVLFHSARLEQPQTTKTVHEPLLDVYHVDQLFGGDFCGLSASFSSGGQRLPLPDLWIPPSMQEWGQVPSCVEVIVSEDLYQAPKDVVLQRETVTILPETGCAVDNLETIQTKHSSTLSSWQVWQVGDHASASAPFSFSSSPTVTSVAALTYLPFSDNMKDKHTIDQVTHMEACFGLNDESNTSGDDSHYRVRVQLSVVSPTTSTLGDGQHPFFLQLNSSKIQINLERQCSAQSSHGTIADGGGLDGRTVSLLLGNTLRKLQDFADHPSSLPSLTDDDDDKALVHVSLALPANVTIAIAEFSNQLQVVDVSYHQVIKEEEEEEETTGSSNRLQRTVVRFSLPANNNGAEIKSQCWSKTISL